MTPRHAWRLSAVALAVAFAHSLAFADDAATAPQDTSQIVVTGSRIPRASKEGPTSVTVITSKEMEQQGYRNVYDALNQQTQNTGFTQGADFGNTFTPAANAVSLRGLGPNHTLVLIDGRRVADYPVAYDGSVNFVNLANIPAALVDRIEILNAGASAIYGSDAIAGVVNVVLKHQTEGVDVDVKVGTTQRGGGDSQRLQLVGGRAFGRLNALFALELSNNEPVWSKDRDFMASSTLQGEAPSVVWGRRNIGTGKYIDPGSTCDAFAGQFGGSVYDFTGSKGSYCGSGQATPSFWTTRTQNQSQNYYGRLNYDLDGGTTLFGDLAVGLNHTKNNTRGPTWTSASSTNSYFFNQITGNYEAWSRRFSPEELGGASVYDKEWHDTAANLSLGARGPLVGSWQYEAVYNISSYESRNRVPRSLAGIDNYFLGPQLGTDSDGVAIFAPNPAVFSQPLTPTQLASLIGHSESRDTAWSHTLAFSANGEVASLPAGPLQAAVLAEVGGQGFANKEDPQVSQGVFYNSSVVPDAAGSRTRYATALELRIPIIKELQATLAGRYDDYRFTDRKDGKFTYNASLEYRPINTLLFRGNVATSFRAPDMNYIYKSQTKGYYASTTDYYRCKLAGEPLSDCEFANASPGANYTENGSKDLKPENGKSFGAGFVWSPSKQFDVSLDYWNIRIDDLVTDLDPDTLLRTEADCRTGALPIGSAQCVDAISRITRNPANAMLDPNAISDIRVNPINAAKEQTAGIDLTTRVSWKTADWGDYVWHTTYTRVLSHKYKQFAGDEDRDLLHANDNVDWPDKLITSLDWTRGPYSSTVTAIRYGRIPDAAEDGGFLAPSILVNLDLGYRINKQATVALTVNNVFNKIKSDTSYGWPYYAVGNYLPYGREAWLSFSYHFS